MPNTNLTGYNKNISEEITSEMTIEQYKPLLSTLSDIISLENESEGAKRNSVSKKRLVGYIATYLFATINLLGITQSIDFNNPIDTLKKLSLIFGASLAPGFTYLGGMQELMEAAENYFERTPLDKNRKTYVLSLLNKIKGSFAEASWKDYLKTSMIGTLAACSTFLDATNTQSGVEAIAGKTAGIIAGIGNGIVEGILPLFTLQQLFNSMTNDFQNIKRGGDYEQKKLASALETIKNFLKDIPKKDSLALKNQFLGMKKSEQKTIKKLMKKIQYNDQLAKQLQLGNINVTEVGSSDFYVRTLALCRILASLTISLASAWAFSRVFSSSQIVRHYEESLKTFNLTLKDISLFRNNIVPTIEPFNPYKNALNQFSYGVCGIVFLPLIIQTFQEIFQLLQLIFGCYDRNSINLKKTAFAFTIAMTGTTCYSLLGLEAANSYQTLQQLLEIEEFEVPQLPFFPDYNFLSIPAILILVSILYGGASNAVKKLYDALFPCKSTSEKTSEKKSISLFFSKVQTQNPKKKNLELFIGPPTEGWNESIEEIKIQNPKEENTALCIEPSNRVSNEATELNEQNFKLKA